jgi:hypothetical protein
LEIEAMRVNPRRTGTHVCGPNELKVLQQIFDAIWLYLRKDGRVYADDEVVRRWVAARVFRFAGSDVVDAETIKAAVIQSLLY